MEPKQIIHLFGESICVWTNDITCSTLETYGQKKEFIRSPLYCAKDFANLQWVFLLKKSREDSYDCIFRLKKCIDENPSLQLTFTIDIEYANFVKNRNQLIYSKRSSKESINLVNVITENTSFFLKNARSYDQITLINKVRAVKLVQLFNYEPFFLNETFSDFVFIVGKNRYPAHKMILAANSPVFTVMFSCEMKEKCLNQVEIKDFEPEVIHEFLCFLYKGNISNWKKFGPSLFAVAHKYEVKSLKSKSKFFLERNLNVKNVINLLVLSDHYILDSLKKKCISLINKEFKTIEIQEDYQNLRKTNPHLLLDIFNNATRKVQEPRLITPSNIRERTIKSGVWTINSISMTDLKVPLFLEIEEIFWTFLIFRKNEADKMKLLLFKKNKPRFHATNNSLKFNISIQTAERIRVEVKIEYKRHAYHLTELDEIGSNLTILWEIESISKADDIQKSNDIWHSLGYEYFFMNPYLSDIIFHSEGEQFPSHKLVLSNKSATFKKIFSSEKESQKKLLNIQVYDIKPKVLKELLRFIYKGKVENLIDIATDLYVAAQKYQIHKLKLMCENSLLKSIDSKNVISALIFSDKHNMECLKDECIFLIIKESIRFEEKLESLKKVDPKVIMEIIHAIHSGKRPMMIRNVNKDEPFFIKQTFKNILCIFGQEILNASFASVKWQMTTEKLSTFAMKLLLFELVALPTFCTITTLAKITSSICCKIRLLLLDNAVDDF